MPVVSTPGVHAERRAVHAQRHHHLLEGGVAGALADPVHRQLHLARAPADRGQRVRGGEAQVVLAVEREHRLREPRHRARAAARSSARHRSGSAKPTVSGMLMVRGARRAAPTGHDLGDEVAVGARRVHRAELDVVGEVARARHHGARPSRARLSRPCASWCASCTSLAFTKTWMRGRRGAAQRLARRVDVAGHGARQRADARVAHLARDRRARPRARRASSPESPPR